MTDSDGFLGALGALVPLVPWWQQISQWS